MLDNEYPLLPLGMYRLVPADTGKGREITAKCAKCTGMYVFAEPMLEISEHYIRICVCCPRCGYTIPVVSGVVQELQCGPLTGRDHTHAGSLDRAIQICLDADARYAGMNSTNSKTGT